MIALFEKIKRRVQQWTDSPAKIARRAAPRIQERLRSDATTRRGNVPQFAPGAIGHPGPTIPIQVFAEGENIRVRGPGWVLQKADEKGQHAAWGAIVAEESRRFSPEKSSGT